jgi:hypothetical protein
MLLQQKQDGDTVLVESLKLIMASSGLLLNLINNLLDVKKVNSESELFFVIVFYCFYDFLKHVFSVTPLRTPDQSNLSVFYSN